MSISRRLCSILMPPAEGLRIEDGTSRLSFAAAVRDSNPGQRLQFQPNPFSDVDLHKIEAKHGRFKGFPSVNCSDLDTRVGHRVVLVDRLNKGAF
ncbi:unnamed protein product [Cuscuta europaea]|uniref:Uncharacterized protein n=1 Tax=Cuscuta europaea TaxID=41803 RepID=A0A9P0ZT12_CUSEU|nr:unnamed protein product [Cuscuta europaea]